MQMPRWIYVQNSDELISSLRVMVATHAPEQLRNSDISPHDRIKHPLEPKICDAF
jgi:hypothetical protein